MSGDTIYGPAGEPRVEALRAELRSLETGPRPSLQEWRDASVARIMAIYHLRLLAIGGGTAEDMLRGDANVMLATQRLQIAEQTMDREWLIWAAGVAGEKPAIP